MTKKVEYTVSQYLNYGKNTANGNSNTNCVRNACGFGVISK